MAENPKGGRGKESDVALLWVPVSDVNLITITLTLGVTKLEM